MEGRASECQAGYASQLRDVEPRAKRGASWPRAKSKVRQGRSRQVRLTAGQASSAHLPEGKSTEADDEAGGSQVAVTGLAHTSGGLAPVRVGQLRQAPHT